MDKSRNVGEVFGFHLYRHRLFLMWEANKVVLSKVI